MDIVCDLGDGGLFFLEVAADWDLVYFASTQEKCFLPKCCARAGGEDESTKRETLL